MYTLKKQVGRYIITQLTHSFQYIDIYVKHIVRDAMNLFTIMGSYQIHIIIIIAFFIRIY